MSPIASNSNAGLVTGSTIPDKNTELYDQFKDVRDYLKGVKLWISPTVKAEIEAAYGDYNTYRNHMFGKVNGLSTTERAGRMSMDELWQELQEMAPDGTFADSYRVDAQQRRQVASPQKTGKKIPSILLYPLVYFKKL